MRVTQSMLSNNMLRNLNTNYTKMSKLQDQINSGKKITRPSDNPVIAVKGMGYRTDLTKNEQFTDNISKVNGWLSVTDDALNQVSDELKRVQTLVTQAANDTNTADDRAKIKIEIEQIKKQIQNVGNTQMAGKYIFSGTHTQTPLFNSDGTMTSASSAGLNNSINIEVFDGITINANTTGYDLFKEADTILGNINSVLGDPNATGPQISAQLESLNGSNGIQNKVLTSLADVGARQNRVEMMDNRLSLQNLSVTKQMSDNEDTDYAKTISDMTTAESIHQAALSVGAKIIQKTLVDFL